MLGRLQNNVGKRFFSKGIEASSPDPVMSRLLSLIFVQILRDTYITSLISQAIRMIRIEHLYFISKIPIG